MYFNTVLRFPNMQKVKKLLWKLDLYKIFYCRTNQCGKSISEGSIGKRHRYWDNMLKEKLIGTVLKYMISATTTWKFKCWIHYKSQNLLLHAPLRFGPNRYLTYTGFWYFGHAMDHTYFHHSLLCHQRQTTKTAHVQVSPKTLKYCKLYSRIYKYMLKLPFLTVLVESYI